MIEEIKEAYTCDDVLLIPRYSDIRSRKEIDLSSEVSPGKKIPLPIISAPMDTVTESDMLVSMSEGGGFGIIHRYNTIDEQLKQIESVRWHNLSRNRKAFIGAAIGVTGDYLERAKEICGIADLICIDVAHGHHILMKEAIENLIKHGVKDEVHIMAGNVATPSAFVSLSEWGADSVRFGIGGGSICSTRVQTGHGVPNLYGLMQCYEAKKEKRIETKIVADGGIKNSGHIVKLLAAGADFVMCGSLLAGTNEAPGYTVNGKKAYRGMASKEAQMDWRGQASSLEGVASEVPVSGPVLDVLRELETGIRSGCSYTGARNLRELRDKAVFVRQSLSAQKESSVHI